MKLKTEEENIDKYLEANLKDEDLTKFNITEITRTGKIAMRKGKAHKVSSEKINAQATDVSWVPENIHTYHK